MLLIYIVSREQEGLRNDLEENVGFSKFLIRDSGLVLVLGLMKIASIILEDI
jgi:hypothetical protein